VNGLEEFALGQRRCRLPPQHRPALLRALRLPHQGDFQSSCREGTERITIFEMEFYYLGDTSSSFENARTKGKVKALESWCEEIRKTLLKALPQEPRPRK
jgi:hypothetical protein